MICYSRPVLNNARVLKCLSTRALFCSRRRESSYLNLNPAVVNYNDVYRSSVEKPEEFWRQVAKGVTWMKPFTKVLDNSNPPFTKWFVGGTLNTCHNAVDRHVDNGFGDRQAIIYDSPITGQKGTVSYKQLQDQVSRMAGVLASLGVQAGDVILIYMPMIPEAIVAMLATTRLGAVHSLVFGGFAAPELSVRIKHSNAKVVLSASVGLEPSRIVNYKPILDEAIHLSCHKPKHCIVLQREGYEKAKLEEPRDIDWQEAIARAQPHDPVPVDASHPVYILYTSGTTGTPKGIIRPTGGHAVILPWTMKAIYDINPGDVWWAASDLGWVVGHSYICYAPLFNCCTTILYEGKPVGTPDEKQFFRVIQEHNVAAMFTAPTALRVIARDLKDENPLNSKTFRHLFVAGEPLDHETRLWAEKVFKIPVLDHWWQTETGYAIAAHGVGVGMDTNPPRGATGKPFMGFDVRVFNAEGKEAQPGELGRIVCKLPLPPGNASSLWKADDRFKETYFEKYPGFYDTMDAGVKDSEGYVYVQARDDDVINVAGHRLSTLSLEEAIMVHVDIIEAAVIGVPDKVKGEVPLGLFVVKPGCIKSEDQLQREVIQIVRQQIGPVAAFRHCAAVAALPKTRSGKTPRKSFADLARDKSIVIPPTIDDPTSYQYILKALRKCGFGLKVPDF